MSLWSYRLLVPWCEELQVITDIDRLDEHPSEVLFAYSVTAGDASREQEMYVQSEKYRYDRDRCVDDRPRQLAEEAAAQVVTLPIRYLPSWPCDRRDSARVLGSTRRSSSAARGRRDPMIHVLVRHLCIAAAMAMVEAAASYVSRRRRRK